MGAAEDLMQRLAVSKKIMEKTEQIKPGTVRNINMPMVEDFNVPQATYNLPQELIQEQTYTTPQHDPTKPLDESRIVNSKLPDEIKRLMIEQPIVQPSSMAGATAISEEIIQGAQRLMNMGAPKTTNEPKKQMVNESDYKGNSNINMSEMKSMIRDVVRDTVRDVVREELKEAGMIVESTTNSNETIQFKVGQHLFIGKVNKVKKLEK
jgi:hypothetical protein